MCWPDYYIFSLVSYVSEIIRMDRGHYSIIALVILYNKSIYLKKCHTKFSLLFLFIITLQGSACLLTTMEFSFLYIETYLKS